MHPDPAFRGDTTDALDRMEALGFAHVATATPTGAMMAHAIVTRHGDALRFHVSRANRVTPHLHDAAVLIGVTGVDGYVSPNWYERPGNQVPTWNYLAIEVDGITRRCDEAALVEHLDALAATHEPRVNPDRPWTRAKMDDAVFRRMLSAIVGFGVEVAAIRATAKLSQNKTAADRAGVIAGLRAAGDVALADTMGATA